MRHWILSMKSFQLCKNSMGRRLSHAASAQDVTSGHGFTDLPIRWEHPTRFLPLGGMSCYLTRVLGCIASTGAFWVGDYSQQFIDRYDDPRWKCPDTVVVWGNNPIVSNSDGLYGHWVIDVMKRGAKLVVIDPRMTWLGSKADIFMGIRPGTDGAMALGLINVVMRRGPLGQGVCREVVLWL